MAELGLIASVIGVAGAGIKLSITLYTFSETVATAAGSIKAIAKDVSLTSAVLEELGSNLKHDEQARLYSANALKTAQTVIVDCEAVFKQIDGALSKSMERIGGLTSSEKARGRSGKVVLSAVERLKWPFLQPKMQELRANLERLKSTLVLMLNVLTYARQVQTEKQKQPLKDDYQRLLIENLVAANQEATRNFQTLLKTIGPANETSSITAMSTTDMSVGGSTLIAQEELSGPEQNRSIVTEQGNSKQPGAKDTSLAKRSLDVDDYEATGIGELITSSTESATETTRACLKRIQQALDQIETSEESLESASQIAVSIEVFKYTLDPDMEDNMRRPWEVAQIRRRYDTGPEERSGRKPGRSQGESNQLLGSYDRRHEPVVQGGAGQDVSNENLLDKTKALLGFGSKPPKLQQVLAGKGTGAGEDKTYDLYIPSDRSYGASGRIADPERTAALRSEIDNSVRIMRENINKVSERGDRLDSLRSSASKQSEQDLLIAQRQNPNGLVDGRPISDNGYTPSPAVKPTDKITAEQQDQLDDTTNIVRQSIASVQQRGERLDSLTKMTTSLTKMTTSLGSGSAQGFRRGTNRARKQEQGWGWGPLSTVWGNIPSAKAMAASTDKFFQEKFEAAFYKDPPEDDPAALHAPQDANSLPEEQVAELKEVFSLFDKNSVGQIRTKDLASLLRPLGENPSKSELRDMTKVCDAENTGAIYFPDFLNMMARMTKKRDFESEIRESFKMAVSDSSSLVSAVKLRDITSGLGIEDGEMDEMIRQVGQDSDGRVDYDGFVQLLTQMDDNAAGAAAQSPVKISPNPQHERLKKKKRPHQLSQGDAVLISYLGPNRPDVAQQAGKTVLDSASQSEAEDDDEMTTSLETKTGTAGEGAPSLESLLKDWTTLYD